VSVFHPPPARVGRPKFSHSNTPFYSLRTPETSSLSHTCKVTSFFSPVLLLSCFLLQSALKPLWQTHHDRRLSSNDLYLARFRFVRSSFFPSCLLNPIFFAFFSPHPGRMIIVPSRTNVGPCASRWRLPTPRDVVRPFPPYRTIKISITYPAPIDRFASLVYL